MTCITITDAFPANDKLVENVRMIVGGYMFRLVMYQSDLSSLFGLARGGVVVHDENSDENI